MSWAVPTSKVTAVGMRKLSEPALVKRALFYDLVALGRTERVENEDWFGVRSGGLFFPMCRASEIEGL